VTQPVILILAFSIGIVNGIVKFFYFSPSPELSFSK
jgi:hypothetical protein